MTEVVIDFSILNDTDYWVAVDGLEGSTGTFSVALADNSVNDLPLPPGALGMLDFTNGVYKWGTALYAPSDVVDHPEYIVPGIGAVMPQYQTVEPFDDLPPFEVLDSPFRDHVFSGNWTLTFEYVSAFFTMVVTPTSPSPPTVPYIIYNMETQFNSYIFVEEDIPSVLWVEADSNHAFEFEIPFYNRMAITRVDDRRISFVTSEGFIHTSSIIPGVVYSISGSSVGWAGYAPEQLWLNGAAINHGTAFSYASTLLARVVFYPATDDGDMLDLLLAEDQLIQPPENDNFADAIAMLVGDELFGHNYRATAETDEPDNGSTSGNSVWYKHTATATATRTVTVDPVDDFNGWGCYLTIYTGSAVNALSLVTGAEDWPGASVSWSAVSGTTYYIRVDGAGGSFDPPNYAYRPGQSPFTISLT